MPALVVAVDSEVVIALLAVVQQAYIYKGRAAVERAFGRLKHESAHAPLPGPRGRADLATC